MVARVAIDNRRPARIPWNYDRGEIVADGVIHAIGICFGLIGVVVLIVIASLATKVVAIESVLVYAAGLLAMRLVQWTVADDGHLRTPAGDAAERRRIAAQRCFSPSS